MASAVADVTIIVVSYNVAEHLARCLAALPAALGGARAEVVIVDNASTDGSAELVRAEYPSARLVVNATNEGFARAVNAGLPLTSGRYVLLLNPDTVAPPSSLARLVALADAEPGAALFAPALREPGTGEIHPPLHPFPTWRTAFRDLTVLRPLLRQRRDAEGWRREAGRAITTGWLGGACLLIRRSLLETIGGLDNRYFMWCEDIEYSRRAIRAGGRVYYADTITVDHWGGRSVRQTSPAWALTLRVESLLAYLEGERTSFPRVLRLVFKVALVVTLTARVPAFALKAATYGLLGRRERAARYRERLRRAAGALGHFSVRLLRS